MSSHDLHQDMALNASRHLISRQLSDLKQCAGGDQLQLAEELRDRILQFLDHWKSWQATERPMSAYAVPKDLAAGVYANSYEQTGDFYVKELQEIRSWLEQLFTFSWNAWQHGSGQLKAKWEELLKKLLNDGFIVVKQPTRVLKTDGNCRVSLYHLLGKILHDLKFKIGKLEAHLLTVSQAKVVHEGGKVSSEQQYPIVGNRQLDYSSDTHVMSAKDVKMNIPRLTRHVERVADEKYALVFKFTAEAGLFYYEPRVLSLPVVVTVHTKQKTDAMATIVWDTAGFEIRRVPFAVPNALPWSQVFYVMNQHAEAVTKRGLTDDHSNFLRVKAVGNDTDRTVSWEQFGKNLPGRTFSFWAWFCAAMKLCKGPIKDQWNDGLVHFMDKVQSEEHLQNQELGTFIVRFPDSVPGGLTIAYSAIQVKHVTPKLAWNSPNQELLQMIHGMNDLRLMWVKDMPSVPKAAVFHLEEVVYCMDDKQAEEYLKNQELGTFIVRFSESVPGGFTISYSVIQIKHVNPYLPGYLQNHKLVQIIHDMNDLRNMWVKNEPSVPKAVKFPLKPDQVEKLHPGYNGRRNRVVVDDQPANAANGEAQAKEHRRGSPDSGISLGSSPTHDANNQQSLPPWPAVNEGASTSTMATQPALVATFPNGTANYGVGSSANAVGATDGGYFMQQAPSPNQQYFPGTTNDAFLTTTQMNTIANQLVPVAQVQVQMPMVLGEDGSTNSNGNQPLPTNYDSPNDNPYMHQQTVHQYPVEPTNQL